MTNGIVVVLEHGKVIIKVIVGCDGHREYERQLAKVIWYEKLRDAEDINSAADALGFGCADCRVVMTEDVTVWPDGDYLVNYRDTFKQIGVNPRFQSGDTRWNPTVLDLDNAIVYEHDERYGEKHRVEALRREEE